VQQWWTKVAPKGEAIPIELVLAEARQGLFIQLRYNTFALFDTGDLGRLADALAERLSHESAKTPK